MSETATTVTLRCPDDEHVYDALTSGGFRRYLERVHAGPTAVGDVWNESVNEGCGRLREVEVTVVAVEGGETLGPDTELRFETPETSR